MRAAAGGIAVESRGMSTAIVVTLHRYACNCPIRGALKLIWWFCSAVLAIAGECGGMCVGKNLGKIFGLNHNFFFIYLWCGRQEKTI